MAAMEPITTPKAFWQQKRFWAFLVAFLSIGYYAWRERHSVDDVIMALLAQLGIVFGYASTVKGSRPTSWNNPVPPRAPGESDESYLQRVRARGPLAFASLLGFVLLAAPSCASRDVTDTGAPYFEIDRGPPCSMAMFTSDGERQGRIRAPEHRCRVIIDKGELP